MAIARTTVTTVLDGLYFADRAVKMTHAAHRGCSFVCTPALLACTCPGTSVAVRLTPLSTGRPPLARMELLGQCAVSLFRAQRLAFHCAGEEGRAQMHELTLKRGDVIAVLGGCELDRDWGSVERTLKSVAHADLEYMAEEMLLELGRGTRRTGGGNGEVVSNSTCVMTVVQDRPSGLLPQPPSCLG
ncbi:uncharacterized protein TEOVI_000184700 [Trypanosoma equiperdum]|uniref:Uncharacterized protein n=2 Tax=Trypanozoon TaxID=39700 RepID=Q383V2_TRYB2|nr:hypothetical protein, conserved [Trypanosoma brucei brucei TREU927]EAN79929.1 hypothetical protein, conserved [Trypanosoma brucei brucei TREU927]SCU70274.1 hypothetical protein, conserved [Trypanosoma equiperdum]